MKNVVEQIDSPCIKDIAEKVNIQEGATLLSVINDKSGLFLVFKYDFTLEDDE